VTVVGEPYWWTLLVNPISEPYWWKLIMNLIHEPYMYTPEIQQSIMLLLSQKFDNLIWQPYSWTLFMNLVCTLQKFNKASCCIVTWIMPDIWLKLDFSCCLKKEIGYEPFRVFSCTISKIELENTLKVSRPIIFSDNNKILLTTRNVRLNRGHYATKYHNWLPTYSGAHKVNQKMIFFEFEIWKRGKWNINLG
jgi:hypothetical protein